MAKSSQVSFFDARDPEDAAHAAEPKVHIVAEGILCDTDSRGYATPDNRSLTEIVLDASEGFIPLWAEDTTLRWKFDDGSMFYFADPEAAKDGIKELLGEAILAWGEAAPIRFSQRDDAWDFKIVVRDVDRCNIKGCVLASAFFPDAGRHRLVIYPRMFHYSREEQIETLAHELGHIFGLRHFFAQIRETTWPSEVFGTHNPFSIMNYGPESQMTQADRDDLKRLYEMAWSGALTHINGTEIRFVRPYHTAGMHLDNFATVFQNRAAALRAM